MAEEQLDRRELLMQAMEAAEEGNLDAPEEKDIEVDSDPISQESSETEAHDEENEEEAKEIEAAESADEDEIQAEEEPKPALQRPTTWKKEYLPIWDKLTSGGELTNEEKVKLAEYSNQRESEYKKGVSTYKAEADRAKPIVDVIAPIEQNLAQRGIAPAQYIQNLVRAEQILSNAPHEQKVQIFQQLAADYGIQLNGTGQMQQLDPYTQQLMNQLNMVNQEVSSIKGRFAQEENQRLMNEIESFRSDVENYPHFDVVREEMAQLLELGKAQDLKSAYKKAVRLNDDVWSLEQERLLKDAKQSASKAQQVAKAKATAVSPKSATPSGNVTTKVDTKDRRSLLSNLIAENNGGRV